MAPKGRFGPPNNWARIVSGPPNLRAITTSLVICVTLSQDLPSVIFVTLSQKLPNVTLSHLATLSQKLPNMICFNFRIKPALAQNLQQITPPAHNNKNITCHTRTEKGFEILGLHIIMNKCYCMLTKIRFWPVIKRTSISTFGNSKQLAVKHWK